MKDNDTYKTIANTSQEILFKEKNSKFYGYAFPVSSEEEVKNLILMQRKKHTAAVHFCYAYQIGTEQIQFRASDDGEPNNSAGMPIYGQIQSFGLTEILVLVVRYFGGTKLGVGGLITAYKTTAQMALNEAAIIEKTIDCTFTISFDYKNINNVMRVVKEQKLQLLSQKMELNCELEVATRKKNANKLIDIFNSMYGVTLK